MGGLAFEAVEDLDVLTEEAARRDGGEEGFEARIGAQRFEVGVGPEQLRVVEARVDRVLQVAERVVLATELGASAGRVVESRGARLRSLRRFEVGLQRFLELADHLQRVAEQEPGPCVIGVLLHDALEQLHRLRIGVLAEGSAPLIEARNLFLRLDRSLGLRRRRGGGGRVGAGGDRQAEDE